MSNKNLIIASGPVIVENNKVLLNQHGDTSFWKFCGGSTSNFSTRLVDIAKERALDEMGITINIDIRNPYFQYTVKIIEDAKVDVVLVHFLAERTGKIIPRKDVRRWAWIPLENLEHENLAPNIIPALKHFGFIK